MPRRCKIIATIGPASNPYQLLQAGATAFRLNFSHGEHRLHQDSLKSIRKAAEELGLHVPVVADLQGPKIRVGKFENGGIPLYFGKTVTLENTHEMGREGLIPLPHPEIFAVIQPGDTLKLDDGALSLTILDVENQNRMTAVP